MSNNKSGLQKGKELYEHQKHYINKILKDRERTNKRNFFISLPQGAGKIIIGLTILSELYNEGKVNNVLILLPRRVLVDQWVEKVQDMFYGFTLKKNPTLSKEKIAKIRGWMKHSNAVGIAMCAHSFKNYLKKGYFSERDFDLVIVDEAADIVVARDFIEGFRMSAYLSGLEKWRTLKIFLMPYQVKEKKLKEILHKFNDKISELIQEEVKDIEQVKYTIREPIVIDDPLINDFTEVLENIQANKENC
jgi:ERCC4-related helicase